MGGSWAGGAKGGFTGRGYFNRHGWRGFGVSLREDRHAQDQVELLVGLARRVLQEAFLPPSAADSIHVMTSGS